LQSHALQFLDVEFEKVEIKEEYPEDSFESEGESSRNLFEGQDFVDPNSFMDKYEGEEEIDSYVPAESIEFSDDIQRKNMKTFNFLKYLIAQKQKSVRALQEKVKDQHTTLTKMKASQ
jgi:hypothetical protein